ncbi:MAG: hypothetical protein IJX34_05145 [Clostridia bacterium]|nr:hypothetical protein [Clostridia bacterium]
MDKIVVEVGSTCTKVDKYDGEKIVHLKTLPIEFKKNFKKENKLNSDDINKLIELVNSLKEYKDIFVCGTSVFRQLNEIEKDEFLSLFKEKTGLEFNIISQEQENIYTVKGATKVVKEALVFVGGGGSTEISYYNNGIKEMKNNKIGVMDILNIFPDLAEDTAKTSLKEIMDYIEERIEVPNVKTDIMILAGGGHEYFARESGVTYEKNTLYNDPNETIMMDIETRIKDTQRYYKEISLDEIRSRVEEPVWWYATRAMCAFVLVVAKKIGAKYIVPTDISMIYGIVLD